MSLPAGWSRSCPRRGLRAADAMELSSFFAPPTEVVYGGISAHDRRRRERMIRVSQPVVGDAGIRGGQGRPRPGLLRPRGEGQRIRRPPSRVSRCSSMSSASATAPRRCTSHWPRSGWVPATKSCLPSLTFVSSFQAVKATGATPVACDVVPETLAIDLEDVERRLTPRTKAVMPVHYAGNPCDMDRIMDFATRAGIRVVEDAAHAFGSVYRGRKIGSFGDVACFSFDSIKNITCGEGGAVVCVDPALADRLRRKRSLGMVRPAPTEPGWKGRGLAVRGLGAGVPVPHEQHQRRDRARAAHESRRVHRAAPRDLPALRPGVRRRARHPDVGRSITGMRLRTFT